jgi:hypothetical protein
MSAAGYMSGMGGTLQEQAAIAALSALDTHSLMAAGGGAHMALGGARLSSVGSGQLAQHGGVAGAPSTPHAGMALGGLLGHQLPPGSPAPSSVGRFSASGVGYGGAAGGGGGRPSFGSELPGSYSQQRHSLDDRAASAVGGSLLSGGRLPALGPIGPSAAPGRDAPPPLSATASSGYGEQLPLSQQPSGLLSPTWSGLSSMTAPGPSGSASSGSGAGARQHGQAQAPWPAQILCPLTQQLITDPVVAADGVSYQREAISEFMRLRDVSPVTGQPLASATLQPNFALRAAIAAEAAKAQQQQQQQQQQQGQGGMLW